MAPPQQPEGRTMGQARLGLARLQQENIQMNKACMQMYQDVHICTLPFSFEIEIQLEPVY
jgi:hypothetical protein